jgi:hypothetical protein
MGTLKLKVRTGQNDARENATRNSSMECITRTGYRYLASRLSTRVCIDSFWGSLGETNNMPSVSTETSVRWARSSGGAVFCFAIQTPTDMPSCHHQPSLFHFQLSIPSSVPQFSFALTIEALWRSQEMGKAEASLHVQVTICTD